MNAYSNNTLPLRLIFLIFFLYGAMISTTFLRPVFVSNYKYENCCQRVERCAQNCALLMQLKDPCFETFRRKKANEKEKLTYAWDYSSLVVFKIQICVAMSLDLSGKVELQCSCNQ